MNFNCVFFNYFAAYYLSCLKHVEMLLEFHILDQISLVSLIIMVSEQIRECSFILLDAEALSCTRSNIT